MEVIRWLLCSNYTLYSVFSLSARCNAGFEGAGLGCKCSGLNFLFPSGNLCRHQRISFFVFTVAECLCLLHAIHNLLILLFFFLPFVRTCISFMMYLTAVFVEGSFILQYKCCFSSLCLDAGVMVEQINSYYVYFLCDWRSVHFPSCLRYCDHWYGMDLMLIVGENQVFQR